MVCSTFALKQYTPSGQSGVACTTGSRDCPEGDSSFQPPLPTFENYFPQEVPLEFNKSSQSLTATLDRIRDNPSRRDLSSLTHDQRNTLLQWEEDEGLGVGSCLNRYPNGEITGGCYSRGNRRAPGHKGKTISTVFTKQAKKRIRRAVECQITTLKLFVTFTCDPKISKLTESGSVDQDWAKERFKQLLNTLKKKYDRMADKTGNESWRLSYIWVAELQQNGNIHFHVLFDRQFIDRRYLVKLWGQATNSVNIKRLNNQEHAVNYILKYMKKGSCPIMGKRYGMTQNLTKGSKPVKYDFYGRSKRNAFLRIKEELEWQIKKNGGYVADWGLSIPAPCRPRIYRGKDGRTYEKPGTSRKIGDDFLSKIKAAMSGVDVLLSYDENLNTDDMPF
jgi:hypothetical protein